MVSINLLFRRSDHYQNDFAYASAGYSIAYSALNLLEPYRIEPDQHFFTQHFTALKLQLAMLEWLVNLPSHYILENPVNFGCIRVPSSIKRMSKG
jgi:hypothetical protein